MDIRTIIGSVQNSFLKKSSLPKTTLPFVPRGAMSLVLSADYFDSMLLEYNEETSTVT
jgi:hypothetical protein